MLLEIEVLPASDDRKMIRVNCKVSSVDFIDEVSETQFNGEQLSFIGAIPLLTWGQRFAPKPKRSPSSIDILVQTSTQASLRRVGRQAQGSRWNWVVEGHCFCEEGLGILKS